MRCQPPLGFALHKAVTGRGEAVEGVPGVKRIPRFVGSLLRIGDGYVPLLSVMPLVAGAWAAAVLIGTLKRRSGAGYQY